MDILQYGVPPFIMMRRGEVGLTHKILILAYAGSSPAAVAKRNINCGGEIGKRLDTGRSDTARLCGGRPLMQTI